MLSPGTNIVHLKSIMIQRLHSAAGMLLSFVIIMASTMRGARRSPLAGDRRIHDAGANDRPSLIPADHAGTTPPEKAPFKYLPPLRMVVLLGILALAISVARVAAIRSDRGFFGQGYMYKEIAITLAHGRGYTEPHGPWRGRPTVMRAPLWPFVLSLPMRICPQCGSIPVTQYSAAFMHAVTAFGVAILVWMVSGSRRRMLLAFGVAVLLPEVQPLMMGGFCEPLSAAILVIGTLLICRGDRFFWGGVFLLSLLPLVRPNFLPLWAVVMALIWWLQFRGKSGSVFGGKRRLIAAAFLFYIPSTVWVARNYFVSGAFPVLAGTASTTFYGNYNPLSATLGPDFGRWVDPNHIPGQEKIESLSLRMSEPETLRYYDSKGKEFVRQHWKIVPLLITAHVVFAALPSPADGAHKYSFWLFRLVLYAAILMAIRQKSIRLNSWFGVLAMGAVLSSATTVVLYSGEGRYLYPLNILLLVLAFAAYAPFDKQRNRFQVTNSPLGDLS